MTEFALPDRFEILEELVRTPAVVLLRARDRTLQREVLLKFPGSGLEATFRDKSASDALLREVRALARLRHPGVARVLDVLETPSGPVQVLEPVAGEPLANRLAREGRLPPAEVARLGLELARILEAVHGAGIIHRGLSTTCVVLRAEDGPFLTGFHFAKSASALGSGSGVDRFEDSIGFQGSALSESAAIALPAFPAPEQYGGCPADERTDLFSLGWVLFLCLTGEAPYERSATGAKPRDARDCVPQTPRALAGILSRCLDEKPMNRFANARELGDALEAVVAGLAGAPGPVRSRTRALVGVGTTLALVAGVALTLQFQRSTAQASEEMRGLAGTRSRSPAVEPAFSDGYERSYALLIGIGDAYLQAGFPALANAESDVLTISKGLERTGGEWQIETLMGAAATGDEVVESLGRLASRTDVNDRVFIYYAGHGIAHESSQNTGWMIPADAKPGRRSTYVRFDEFSNFFAEAKAKHVLVAMDCCYGGRLTTMRSAKADVFRRRFLQEKAHVILSSGRADEQVSDGDRGSHSPFAEAFLEALEQGETITSHMLYSDILRRFNELDVRQTPVLGYPKGSTAQGQFVFML